MSAVEATAQGRGFRAGDVIADKYELEELVGEGGMGSVWRARHRQLESHVALKLMSPAIAAQPEALNRFLREARAAARLSSLHVVKVFDFGVAAETPFIAMELLIGESLRARLERLKRLSPEATLWVIRQTGRALSKAHGEGIVHRDLKPENLFITQQEDELLKVLDFGVAKLSGGGSGIPSTSTRTGALLGTPFYMSPEQARGIKAIDHRSDIWSLAVIAFECITGRMPFESQAFGDLVLKICTLPAPVPSSVAPVPAGFDAWFARATERDPEQRYQSVDELVEALQAAFADASAAGKELAATAVAARAEAMAHTERPPRQAVTRTDVTASQTLMAVVPRRRLVRRAWLLVALAGLFGTGALVLFFARAEDGRPARGAPTARAKTEREPRVAATSAPAVTELPDAAAPAAGSAETASEGAPALGAEPVVAPVTSPRSSAEPTEPAPAAARNSEQHSAPHRTRKPAPATRLTPRVATTPADQTTKSSRPDLFSDPD